MIPANTPIPFYIVQWLIAYFTDSITMQEKQALDDWVSASMENQGVFEACLEVVHPGTLAK